MFKFLDDTPVPVTCHACGKQQQKKLKWFKKNKSLKCKKCGKKIDLSKPEVRKTLKQVTQAVRDFEKTLGRMHASTSKNKSRKTAARRAPKQAAMQGSVVQQPGD